MRTSLSHFANSGKPKKAKTDSKLYKDGKEHNQFGEMIIPGIFLVIFYVTAGFFSKHAIINMIY